MFFVCGNSIICDWLHKTTCDTRFWLLFRCRPVRSGVVCSVVGGVVWCAVCTPMFPFSPPLLLTFVSRFGSLNSKLEVHILLPALLICHLPHFCHLALGTFLLLGTFLPLGTYWALSTSHPTGTDTVNCGNDKAHRGENHLLCWLILLAIGRHTSTNFLPALSLSGNQHEIFCKVFSRDSKVCTSSKVFSLVLRCNNAFWQILHENQQNQRLSCCKSLEQQKKT